VDTSKLSPELAQLEQQLAHAIDLYAEGEDAKADARVERTVEALRGFLQGPERRGALMLWAMALQMIREPQMALLRYEEVLKEDPSDEEALWQSVQIFLVDLELPDSARKILEERLLPISDRQEYRDALLMARLAVGERPSRDTEPAA
jgi:tetratricopeptide (TPR) repeat protein